MSDSAQRHESNRQDESAVRLAAPLEAVVTTDGHSTGSGLPAQVQSRLDREQREKEGERQIVERHRVVLNRLRDRAKWVEERHESPYKFGAQLLGFSKAPSIPEIKELNDMFNFFIPLEKEVKVTVCNFCRFDHKVQQEIVSLQDLDKVFDNAPNPNCYLIYTNKIHTFLQNYITYPLGQKRANLSDPLFLNQSKARQQILSRFDAIDRPICVSDSMTCIRTSNGNLLTVSSTKGENWYRQLDLADVFDNERILEYIAGTRELTVNQGIEILLLDIILRLHESPMDLSEWRCLAEVAYSGIIRNLNTLRKGQLHGKDSVSLLQDYITCIDEIRLHLKATEEKIDYLTKLKNNYPSLDGASEEPRPGNNYDNPIKANFLGYGDRCEFIIGELKSQQKALTEIQNEAKSALDVYFQLKTIEQNERAIYAESNNQAILVFTVVTVIFLPLSFFTSYFGMNLNDIVDTDKQQSYFWKLHVYDNHVPSHKEFDPSARPMI
ncbi:MAG: hypothetical protein Q9219_006813 [cf. Caloplaca sp. 3 TL-2023]